MVFLVLLADPREPAVATPAVAAAADVHPALGAPAAEGGVGSRAVLAEVPLRCDGTLVGERRVVLEVFRQGERVALHIALLVLGGELCGSGGVVELEELQVDVRALALGHRVHDRTGRVLLTLGGVERLLRGLVAVDAADVEGEHAADHLDELAEQCEEHHPEVVGPEDFGLMKKTGG